jgi:hypothetical protein
MKRTEVKRKSGKAGGKAKKRETLKSGEERGVRSVHHEAAVLLDEDKMGLLDEPVHEADQLAHDGD